MKQEIYTIVAFVLFVAALYITGRYAADEDSAVSPADGVNSEPTPKKVRKLVRAYYRTV